MANRLANGPPPDAIINKTCGADFGRLEDIAAVEDHGRFHETLELRKIRTSKFIPLSHDDQRIGAADGVEGGGRTSEGTAACGSGILHRDRIVGANDSSGFDQICDEAERWSFAHIICPWFEGEAPDCDGFAFELAAVAEVLRDTSKDDFLLPVIDSVGGIDQIHGHAIFATGVNERFDVFRKTAAAETYAWVEKRRVNTLIGSETFANLIDIGAELISQQRKFVDEADFHREKSVGRVLGHFG